jgi:heme/copper-type cytochrome/quinol oxidase subunit 2
MLLGVVFWLYCSYAPGAADALPKLTALSAWTGRWLPALAALALASFVLVQLLILRATVRLRTATAEGAKHNIHLNFMLELLWAVLPLVMTLLLAVLSYRTWVSLGASY